MHHPTTAPRARRPQTFLHIVVPQGSSKRFKQTGVGDPYGKLVGKAALQAYFQEALDNVAVIKLDLQVKLSSWTAVMYSSP
jgi:hypothetical protein